MPNTNSPDRSPARRGRRGRRSPVTSVALMLVGLLATGGAYALFTTSATAETSAEVETLIAEGQKLFDANCASCHGLAAEGTEIAPTLIGVGAASVDFQVGTGRMPMAASGPQAEIKPVQFTDDQIRALAVYVHSLGPGPDIPDARYLDGQGNIALGGELFRINCAMCHNVGGAGGALTQGKFAPDLHNIEPAHIYEAMVTGPQNMPIFNDLNLTPESKRDIISYLLYLDDNPAPGGLANLGGLGPVSEGLFVWIFVLGGIVALTVWMTARSN